MEGPMEARRVAGLDLYCICILPMALTTIRWSVPRQPAWTAAMARFFGSTRRMGTQSAVCTGWRSPGQLEMDASTGQVLECGAAKRYEYACRRRVRERRV